jgi:hypothetical protein
MNSMPSSASPSPSLSLYRGWEEPLANEPTGVYQHSDGRPLLGRTLAGKSERQLRDGWSRRIRSADTDG